ncbi:hypothetical protein Cgig2_007334 [Carnegiea gigantea]|uniref:F-box domain-containing protein n=1 Tax=Carnegiea gigantea TaxID=171969 RepID=A0A9Q1KZW6_9CARY|nr:hypothetical protein Cgig2_007334 [Carnegiea gigantea]
MENSSIHDVPGQKKYFTWQRKRKQSKNCKDIISSLTDDILIHILSLLDLREAATTSVLSKRWRYVWANLSNLDFHGTSTLHGRGYSTRYESEACKYAHRVNQAVSSSLAPRIHKFRVRFLLGASYGYDIHTWVNFAMRKYVKELELNFSSCLGVVPEDPFYIDSFRCYARYPFAHSLVSLSLSGLSISGYFLESVLFNFPNLERLTMKHLCCGQSKLNVVGDLLKLRHLEISYCYHYKELEISAGNLISFVYIGLYQNVKFSYVPLLNEVSISGPHSLHTIRSLHNSGFLPQLTELELRVIEIQDFVQSPIRFPQCGNLKQLDFTFCDGAYHSLLIFTNLIDACPVLHKFKLQRNFNEPYRWYYKMISRGNVIKVAKKHHHSLKIFEMVGFRGNLVDIELVLCLAQFAIVFEKVILDPHLPIDRRKPSERNTCEQIEASRKQAKLLQNQLPPRVLMEVV